ncbi:hypothetical protein T02_14456 [Trichinella nativa]|uniref:Uncharacterized protein n=3 Tax=Trichinella TaxID=6333 RepID=A0A0V1LH84_9BILA|nr:hypothetical protein T05_13845 [Trichinella murrelli]KRY49701.1 hypothetical protein T03_159 [Trichinella britovi]KRZ58897.1 hypothetical protein T02_14456 [Trichinella nativa]
MLDVYEMKIPPVLINTDQWAFPCVAISPKPFLPFQSKKLPLNQRNDSHPLCKQCHAQCSIETGLNLKLEHLFNVIGP